MKKITLHIFLFLTSFIYAADVTGNVFLDNQTDFQNSTITFTPVSPSAVFGEVNTNSNGSFSTNLSNGVYNIKYHKDGYLTYELFDILINESMILNNVTLSSNNLVVVNGNVSGLWTKGNTYKVTGNITVPTGETLTIQEGVDIKFDGYYSLIVNGTIIANGTANNFVKFTSNSTNPTNKDWNQILINSFNSSTLDYCIIEYGKKDNDENEGVLSIKGNLILSNSIVRNSEETGVSIRSSGNVSLKKNEIYNCSYGAVASGIGIIIFDSNHIYNNQFFGISVGLNSNSVLVKKNIIHNCNYIGLSVSSDIKVERNILFNNPYGVFVCYSKPTIINNTIMFNQNGIGLYDNEIYKITNPIISSNIITNNLHYGIHSQGVNKPDSVSYNLFYNNGSGIGNILPVGVSPIITSNINGTPADAYYNIFVDPKLETTTLSDKQFCFLTAESPAINAGDPTIKTTGDIIDIGAIELGGNLSVHKTNTIPKVNIFPNPVTDYIVFQSNINNTFNSIKIFDVNGKIIEKIIIPIPTAEYKWETATQIIKGIYFYQIMNDKKTIGTGKFIKK
jgi:parallel beta-helix repeat protein